MADFMNDDDQFALSKFESMLKTNKVYFFDSDEFEEIVYFYMDSGKLSLANKAIELSLTQHPTSLHLQLIKVELLVFEKKFKIAERLLQSLESFHPDHDEIYIQKASILSKKDQHKEAIEELLKALKLTEDLIDVHALLGMEYLFIDEFDLAKDNFEFCLNVDVEDYSALYNIIYCFDIQDQTLQAIDFLNNYINRNPYSEVAWHQLGREYAVVEKYNESIRALDYAILIDGLFVGAYLEKASVLEKQNKFEEAISNYMMTLKLDDATAFTYIQIGDCYEAMDDVKMAIKYYLKAIDENPQMDKSWLLLTNSYLNLKKPEKALYYIQKALKVSPDNSDYLNQRAEIYIRLNLFEEASTDFRKSISLGDNRMELFIALIDVLHFIGEYNDAYEILLSANNKYPNNDAIKYRMSGINHLLGKKNEALLVFEDALKLNYSYHKKMIEFFPIFFDLKEVKSLIYKFNN